MATSGASAVKCKLSRGAFSDEVVFEVELADGGVQTGACSRAYCYNSSGHPLASEQPEPAKVISGRLAMMQLGEAGPGRFRIAVPDGEVLIVHEGQLTTVKEGSPHVPVRP